MDLLNEARGPLSRKQQIAVILKTRLRKSTNPLANHPDPITRGLDKRSGEFDYRQSGKKVPDKTVSKILEKATAPIPPAWTDVKINPDKNASLIAIGKDQKGRTQYRYSRDHTSGKAAEKFTRLKEFTSKRSRITGEIEVTLKRAQPNTEAYETALALKLVDKLFIRAGSETETMASTKAYGAATLLRKHVSVNGKGRVGVNFPAKKGTVVDTWLDDDKTLSSQLAKQIEGKKPSDPLFPNASTNSMSSFLRKHGDFTTKDFRTYHGSRIAFEEISKYKKLPSDLRGQKEAVNYVLGEVSGWLQNTPAVAKAHYINPAVWGPWLNKGLRPELLR